MLFSKNPSRKIFLSTSHLFDASRPKYKGWGHNRIKIKLCFLLLIISLASLISCSPPPKKFLFQGIEPIYAPQPGLNGSISIEIDGSTAFENRLEYAMEGVMAYFQRFAADWQVFTKAQANSDFIFDIYIDRDGISNFADRIVNVKISDWKKEKTFAEFNVRMESQTQGRGLDTESQQIEMYNLGLLIGQKSMEALQHSQQSVAYLKKRVERRSDPVFLFKSEASTKETYAPPKMPNVSDKEKQMSHAPLSKSPPPVADSPKAHTEKPRGERWAVVMGISKYKDSRIPGLRYAAEDAKAFYEWLISPTGGRYAPARIKLLLNEECTSFRMKKALFSWLKRALKEDMVTIYFAGHGSPESPDSIQNLFLLAYDTRYDSISSTGFPMWDIETALKRYIKARKVVVIADACHAAGVGQSFDVARRAGRGIKVNPISTGIQELSMGEDGVCVISASAEDQFSSESEDWGGGHGVFTHFLLKGLQGEADYSRDGVVTLGEVTSYVSQEVRRATRNAQNPTVAGRYDPALSIGQ